MKIRRTECLVLVALVSSATVMELRLNTLDTTPQSTTQATRCATIQQQGVGLAGCGLKQHEHRVEGTVPQSHRASALWV
ncbi:hypothetical protein [Paraburkholderia saeva]|uniref:hypothetical protein n=1 Tax=Paraburkholderia saeva TaxID=2777537 RepID=UPI001E0FBC09|nr:hypothetical protein [Paraburkholderia saeva]CAG4889135.1 hypothetical protein R52603_00879 [Paraburkholderia saeva]